MTEDLALDVGYRYVCLLTISGPLQANTVTVSCGSYVLRPLCHIPASDDGDNEEAGSYLFLGEHYRRMGCYYDRMYRHIVPLIDGEKADTLKGMGFTKNWKDMLVCRILLGLLEAGIST